MSANLKSLSTALLAGGIIDAKDYAELENEELLLTSRIAKLTICVRKWYNEGHKGLAEILEANKEQHGDSEVNQALKKIVDSNRPSSCEYHTETLK